MSLAPGSEASVATRVGARVAGHCAADGGHAVVSTAVAAKHMAGAV
jgi:hypothetical protein